MNTIYNMEAQVRFKLIIRNSFTRTTASFSKFRSWGRTCTILWGYEF